MCALKISQIMEKQIAFSDGYIHDIVILFSCYSQSKRRQDHEGILRQNEAKPRRLRGAKARGFNEDMAEKTP